ncbi:MAG TPA: plastocyanin/azurin family copper-binding protein, partial [Candidatus Limnocylindria bacterium]
AGVMVGLAAASPDARPRRIEIVIHYSGFGPTDLTVPHGVPITFVWINGDPIDHEWLLGDAAFHARHRTGTEPFHGNRPFEVSLPPLSSGETTLAFDAPGTLRHICHVPGHEAYGMVGRLKIT